MCNIYAKYEVCVLNILARRGIHRWRIRHHCRDQIPYRGEIMNHDYVGSFWQCQMSQKAADTVYSESADHSTRIAAPVKHASTKPKGQGSVIYSHSYTQASYVVTNIRESMWIFLFIFFKNGKNKMRNNGKLSEWVMF